MTCTIKADNGRFANVITTALHTGDRAGAGVRWQEGNEARELGLLYTGVPQSSLGLSNGATTPESPTRVSDANGAGSHNKSQSQPEQQAANNGCDPSGGGDAKRLHFAPPGDDDDQQSPYHLPFQVHRKGAGCDLNGRESSQSLDNSSKLSMSPKSQLDSHSDNADSDQTNRPPGQPSSLLT